MRIGLRFQIIKFCFLFLQAKILFILFKFYIMIYVTDQAKKEKGSYTIGKEKLNTIEIVGKSSGRCIKMYQNTQFPPAIQAEGIEQELKAKQ